MKMSGRVYKGRIRNSLKEHVLATTKTTAIEKSAFEAPLGDFVASSDGLRKGLQQGVTAFAEAGALSKQNVDAGSPPQPPSKLVSMRCSAARRLSIHRPSKST